MNIFEKAKKKIVELWQGANLCQKIGLGIIVTAILFIKIIKWVVIFKFLFDGLVWLGDWFYKGFSGLSFKEQLTTIGALLTAIIAVWRLYIADANKKIADKTLITEQKKELHERYARAVELLSNDDDSVRMGALYSLKQIAEENDGEFFEQCKEIIAGYVRNQLSSEKLIKQKAEWQEAVKSDSDRRRNLPEDIKSGINLLSSLAKSKYFKDKYINLNGIYLSGVDFSKSDMNFHKIDFSHASLTMVKFKDKTNLSTCVFISAFMRNINLHAANLQGVSFYNSNLKNADLSWCLLQETNFLYANLNGANLMGAKLDKANMFSVNLADAHLGLAKLNDINDLRGTLISQSQFDKYIDKEQYTFITLKSYLELEENINTDINSIGKFYGINLYGENRLNTIGVIRSKNLELNRITTPSTPQGPQ